MDEIYKSWFDMSSDNIKFVLDHMLIKLCNNIKIYYLNNKNLNFKVHI